MKITACHCLVVTAFILGIRCLFLFKRSSTKTKAALKVDKEALIASTGQVCASAKVIHNRNIRLACRFFFHSQGAYDYLPDQLELNYLEKLRFTRTPPSCNKGIELLIAVNSAAGNKKKREAIRKTWKPALEANGNIAVVFLAGTVMDNAVMKEVLEEADKHKDIVLMQVLDEYRRLTIKNILMYKWLLDYCIPAQFLLKCDDDVSFNPYVLDFLRKELMEGDDNNIYGQVLGAGPQRGTRWDLPSSFYPSNQYPIYLAGPVVFQSRSIAKRIFEFLQVIPTFGIDDVIVNGIAAALADIDPLPHKSLNGVKPLPKNPRIEYPAFAWLTGGADKILSDWSKVKEFYNAS